MSEYSLDGPPVAGYRDYSLTGPEGKAAHKKGLVDGQWFTPHIERQTLRKLMQRDDYHAARDTVALAAILFVTASISCHFWSEGRYFLFALSFWVYCTFYTSCGDSRWHECGHGTAFKTKWLNDLVYEAASFMVFREPLVWKFSHARHHTDTDIVGRDPEIDARPLDMYNLFIAFFNVQGIRAEAAKIWMHGANGKLSDAEKEFVPAAYRDAVFRQARVWLCIYCGCVIASVMMRSPLPAAFIFMPYTLGAWHFVLTGVFQHASMEQDVLDHRKSTRTVLINPLSSFIYWK
jgi:fatty acid desaturase